MITESAFVAIAGLVAVIALFFIVSISSVSFPVSTDTLSGLVVEPWKLATLVAFGLFAIVTSYWPMSIEVRNALVTDLRWPRGLAMTSVLFLPYFLVLAGLNSFLLVVEIVGGIFLAVQYLLILAIARAVLKPSGWRRLGLDALMLAFLLAIAYQFYYLLV